MKIFWRFLLAELIWAAGIFALVLPLTILSSGPLSTTELMRWLGHAVRLAMFPAGIAVAGNMTAEPRRLRPWLGALAGAVVVAAYLFLLHAVAIPAVGNEPMLPQLVRDMTAAANSWETRNHAAWMFLAGLLTPVQALLLAAIGVQVGIWTPHAVAPPLRRLLYWIIGIGLAVSGYSVWDSTYETIVLHTSWFVGFAAFYTLLVPAGIAAGLALPTLAVLRGATIEGRTS